MILFDNIGQLMKQADTNNLRIFDRAGTNWIMDVNEASPENAFAKLLTFKEMLSGYQVLVIRGANDAQEKGHYSGGSTWKVYFPAAAPGIGLSGPGSTATPGYSKELMDTKVQLETLKLTMMFDQKFAALEKKMGGGNDEEKYLKYFPLVAPMLGIKDEDVFKRLQMCALAGNLSGLSGMMGTGAAGANKLSIEGTDAEKEKMVEKLVPEIFGKVDKTKFIQVLEAVKNNPEFLNTAHAYMSLQQPAAMAGATAEQKRIDYLPAEFVPASHEDENF